MFVWVVFSVDYDDNIELISIHLTEQGANSKIQRLKSDSGEFYYTKKISTEN